MARRCDCSAAECGASSANSPANESRAAPAVVALVGNPNTGKTALFNALTGFQRHVANYPGVTVDLARGPVRGTQRPIELLDLPGSYSLAAAAPDEMVLCNALCGRLADGSRPTAIVAIVDASNPQRNFYLLSQVLELGLPVVVALNMIDIARARGLEFDAAGLAQRLGVPVVPVIATQPKTTVPLARAIETILEAPPPHPAVRLPAALTQAAVELIEHTGGRLTRAEALRVLVDQDGYAERQYLAAAGDGPLLDRLRGPLATLTVPAGAAEVRARYAWINEVLAGVITRQAPAGDTWSARLDRVLTHRVGGALAFIAVLYLVFYTIYAGAGPLMDGVSAAFGWLGATVGALLPAGALRSLVMDGLFAGVGGVLAFLPQILILFAFIAVLEDCGYLPRAAFMVDRLMQPLGLSGRSFIPLLSGFACAVPAILGTRAIADRRERIITILMIPLMSCSARLPVYLLMIAAFVPPRSWLGGWVRLDALVMLALYVLGITLAIPLALVLRRSVFRGPPAGFMLELPTYKRPRLRTILQRVYLAGRSFLVRAGSIILIVNLVVWTLGYFPHGAEHRPSVRATSSAGASATGVALRHSFLGRMGEALEPAIRPLGWDWRIGLAVIASFPAREQVIATLGTICNLDPGTTEEGDSLRDALRRMSWADSGAPLFTLPVALSLMVFFALCAQCGSTLVMIGRETGSWGWSVASFVGMTTLAYAAAWGVAAGGRALGW